jgi:hypothetical protein
MIFHFTQILGIGHNPNHTGPTRSIAAAKQDACFLVFAHVNNCRVLIDLNRLVVGLDSKFGHVGMSPYLMLLIQHLFQLRVTPNHSFFHSLGLNPGTEPSAYLKHGYLLPRTPEELNHIDGSPGDGSNSA